jgi:hypothetical protein
VTLIGLNSVEKTAEGPWGREGKWPSDPGLAGGRRVRYCQWRQLR